MFLPVAVLRAATWPWPKALGKLESHRPARLWGGFLPLPAQPLDLETGVPTQHLLPASKCLEEIVGGTLFFPLLLPHEPLGQWASTCHTRPGVVPHPGTALVKGVSWPQQASTPGPAKSKGLSGAFKEAHSWKGIWPTLAWDSVPLCSCPGWRELSAGCVATSASQLEEDGGM